MLASPLLLQSAGSLVAIVLLAGLARWLGLGAAPVLSDHAAVERAASEVEDGFTPVDSAISQDHKSALARDAAGRIMLIRLHGNRFAGRVLAAGTHAQWSGDVLVVDCGERRFGAARLVLDDPASWAEAINRLGQSNNA
ncbi:MAG: hypothetical protein ACXIT4_03530 [Erythrobacter sp.]